MAKIIGVKFKNSNKVYYFAPEDDKDEFAEGDGVIVETARGTEIATVSFGIKEVDDASIVHPLKPILRKATEADVKRLKENEAHVPEALEFAQAKIEERKLPMKLIGAEFSFDGKKLTYTFSSESRVDFRELVKDLASKFHVRIELRQIGIRDEAKLLGGIAPCGRECCCASCMKDFGKVSVKMAKSQGLHLNQAKISGLCGRLMCCLEYEDYYYSEVYKKMPKIGGTISTPEGDGVVVSTDMLKLMVKVKISKADGSDVYKDFALSDVQFKKRGGNREDDCTENDVLEQTAGGDFAPDGDKVSSACDKKCRCDNNCGNCRKDNASDGKRQGDDTLGGNADKNGNGKKFKKRFKDGDKKNEAVGNDSETTDEGRRSGENKHTDGERQNAKKKRRRHGKRQGDGNRNGGSGNERAEAKPNNENAQ